MMSILLLEVVTTPGTSADIHRAIQLLPGVQAVDDGTARFVRGGDYTETRVFMNEAQLLNPQQLLTPTGTFVGTVDPFQLEGEGALEQLAACLRHVLEVNALDTEEIALGDELAFVRDYLALERLRHGDRLQVVEEIEGDLLDAPVMPFVLQPLVENAIRHGMAPLARPVTIRLVARAQEEVLQLEVADDGAGGTAQSRDGGIGLHAIRRRLHARHGSSAGLQVTTAPGEGFGVHLTLPLHRTRISEVVPR